jgi:hypothetical protein
VPLPVFWNPHRKKKTIPQVFFFHRLISLQLYKHGKGIDKGPYDFVVWVNFITLVLVHVVIYFFPRKSDLTLIGFVILLDVSTTMVFGSYTHIV